MTLGGLTASCTRLTSVNIVACLIITVVITSIKFSYQQSESLANPRTEPFYIDLDHKLNSFSEFKPRGSILVRPKTDHRPGQAIFVEQDELTETDVELLRDASEKDDLYCLRATYRGKKTDKSKVPVRVTQTTVKARSLQTSNLIDLITINLSPINEFLSVNLNVANGEIAEVASKIPSNKFNTTLTIFSASLGPQPDTATYIKRLEEERQSKLKQGKEDNRSFLAKYWIYIVPGVIILMMLGGPEQGAR